MRWLPGVVAHPDSQGLPRWDHSCLRVLGFKVPVSRCCSQDILQTAQQPPQAELTPLAWGLCLHLGQSHLLTQSILLPLKSACWRRGEDSRIVKRHILKTKKQMQIAESRKGDGTSSKDREQTASSLLTHAESLGSTTFL